MIELRITGKCRKCPFMKIDAVGLIGITPDHLDMVQCSRKEFCDQLEDYLRRTITLEESEK